MAVTWNPVDKHANVILSNGNLTANANTLGENVKGVEAKSSGKWYFEIVLDTVFDNQSGGIATAAASNSSFLNTANSGIYCLEFKTGGLYYANGTSIFPDLVGAEMDSVNDVLGVLLNLDANTIQFKVNNGQSKYSAKTIPAGTYYPWCNPAGQLTGRFKTADFSYAVPTGYEAWDNARGAKVNVAGSWVEKPVKIHNGTSWVQKGVKLWNGSAWE